MSPPILCIILYWYRCISLLLTIPLVITTSVHLSSTHHRLSWNTKKNDNTTSLHRAKYQLRRESHCNLAFQLLLLLVDLEAVENPPWSCWLNEWTQLTLEKATWYKSCQCHMIFWVWNMCNCEIFRNTICRYESTYTFHVSKAIPCASLSTCSIICHSGQPLSADSVGPQLVTSICKKDDTKNMQTSQVRSLVHLHPSPPISISQLRTSLSRYLYWGL